MSVLTAAVQARVPADRLVQLTNKNDRTATTIDTTILATAADDAVAEFEIKAGRTFDDTDARHIRLVVPGVVAFLRSYNHQEAADAAQAINSFAKRCEEFRKTDVNARVLATGTRGVGPSPDVDAEGAERRPEFDAPRFVDLDVNPPRGA